MLFSGVSSAATQAEVQAAIEAALAPYQDSGGGFYTIPYSEQWDNIGLMLVTSDGGGTVADGVWGMWRMLAQALGTQYTSDSGYVSEILQVLQRIEQLRSSGDTNLVDFLTSIQSNTTSIDGTTMDIAGYLPLIWTDTSEISSSSSDILTEVRNYGSAWDLIRDGDQWRVHDDALIRYLQTALYPVDGISSSLKSIGVMLEGIEQDWLTKPELEEVLHDIIENAQAPEHDVPSADIEAEKEEAERSADYEWTRAESASYSNKWELASWEYTKMLPGNASIVSDNPSDNPGGTGFSPDDSGIPLFSRAVVAEDFGMSIDSSVIEPNDYPIFMSYYQEFRVRWASIFHAVWDFIGAFMVFFIARREWKYYMGVGDNAPEVETDAGGIF